MKMDELSDAQSHMLGRMMAIECALNVLITTNPHSREIAGAIRERLQELSAHAIYEPVRDGLIDGIQAGASQILRYAENSPSSPPKPA